jgi:hypothetical protein
MQCTQRVTRYKEGPVTPVDPVHARDIQDPSASHQLDVLLLNGECPGPDAVHLFQALVKGLESEAGHGEAASLVTENLKLKEHEIAVCL